MKRKIAAIMAADVAGYSRLVSEDEEETLRRLAAYREVFDDFVVKASGRIFNTAGDAVLAEFSSAVEAVRCAIDIQESLRTRNMAYPPSRQMNFRIGITIGDVVEREGDLLGDGVNIAARLEGIAPVGGICVSRNVYEQVANKLSVQFADIGEQQVKNIPNPVHAFTVAMGGDGEGQKAAPLQRGRKTAMPLIAAIGGTAAIAIAAVVYFFAVPPAKPPAVVAAAPSAPRAAVPAQTAPPQVKLVAETIPMIPDRDRASIRNNYMAAPGHKAIAISPRRGDVPDRSARRTNRKGRRTRFVPGFDRCHRRSAFHLRGLCRRRRCRVGAHASAIAACALAYQQSCCRTAVQRRRGTADQQQRA